MKYGEVKIFESDSNKLKSGDGKGGLCATPD
jgi:hypothetical protein